jgi:hypothetical protein
MTENWNFILVSTGSSYSINANVGYENKIFSYPTYLSINIVLYLL